MRFTRRATRRHGHDRQDPDRVDRRIDFSGLRPTSRAAAVPFWTTRKATRYLTTAKPSAGDWGIGARAGEVLALRGHVTVVCCEAGDGIIYVSIEETGSPTFHFRSAPQGSTRLPTRSSRRTSSRRAGTRSDVASPRKTCRNGQSLIRDPATRAVQMRGRSLASTAGSARFFATASDSNHRALAAQILGYADEQACRLAISYSTWRSVEDVRNNAMRALPSSRCRGAVGSGDVRIPPEPLVHCSAPGAERSQQGVAALAQLTERPDPALLRLLRQQAGIRLAEMARWKSEGHAMPAFMISDASRAARTTRSTRRGPQGNVSGSSSVLSRRLPEDSMLVE